MCFGTCYSQPERIKGESQGAPTSYTASSDVWSLGLSVIEAACGHYPYPPETYQNVFAQLTAIVHGDPPALPDSYSPTAQDFVAQCLRKQAHTRPTYSQLLVRAPSRSLSLSLVGVECAGLILFVVVVAGTRLFEGRQGQGRRYGRVDQPRDRVPQDPSQDQCARPRLASSPPSPSSPHASLLFFFFAPSVLSPQIHQLPVRASLASYTTFGYPPTHFNNEPHFFPWLRPFLAVLNRQGMQYTRDPPKLTT